VIDVVAAAILDCETNDYYSQSLFEKQSLFLEDFSRISKLVPQAGPGAAGGRGVGRIVAFRLLIGTQNPEMGPLEP
jgi:hypothetical protein